jgi:UDP-N-acetylenolpyruvoylglucosamine reductase
MIDELGLKGFQVGGARVSDRHANFFVNAGKATSADMLELISQVREKVRGRFGVELETEVILWTEA